MDLLTRTFLHASKRARERRALLFRKHFSWIGPETKILDVGSEDGSNIHRVLTGFQVTPANIHVADISRAAVMRGYERFGYTPVVIGESDRLPFEDQSFDLVYCSSVIEHVTVPKTDVWKLRDGREFRKRAFERQQTFAQEVRRVARHYFVQTPNRYFPIESHTWLPFIAYLPRSAQLAALRVSNRIWIKRTTPDWNLLTAEQMRALFPDAQIEKEISAGLVKSWMAIA